MKRFFLAAVCFGLAAMGVKAADRWAMQADGSIVWLPQKNEVHQDHVEMSGKQMSVVLRYGVRADGSFHINKSMVWPMLRRIPNNTNGSLMRRFDWDALRDISVKGLRDWFDYTLRGEQVDSIVLKGSLRVVSHYPNCGLAVTREFGPSTDKPALVERYTIKNNRKEGDMLVTVPAKKLIWSTPEEQGVNGSYTVVGKVEQGVTKILKPGESLAFDASIQAYSAQKGEKELTLSTATELAKRAQLLADLQENLVLSSPDPVIDRMFAFSKVRASESIYETAGGPMHGPGGESYYAAIWANDQAEYVNPFFPYEGYEYGNQSAMTSYKMFARFQNDAYKPVPSSIIAEGIDTWNGAGDRGDAAMIAYGSLRYLLARGSMAEAKELWPFVQWCLEFCKRKTTAEGVIASDSDELEGRFPAGKANLCTSSLYYDALVSAAYICRELGEPAAKAKAYADEAKKLRTAMDKYFGAEVEGFKTYQYYEGNTVLRSWICIPLVMGITERAEGTIAALLSPRLFTKDGLLTQAGSETFWDRTTLYALRGIFAAGEADKALDFLHYYSQTRLLGDHVPYAIEAWPEGSQRHLSAESGLYARIITEGLFGIRPTGFKSFDLKPSMPSSWNTMSLQHIRAHGDDFAVKVDRVGKSLKATITPAKGKAIVKTFKPGQTIRINLPE